MVGGGGRSFGSMPWDGGTRELSAVGGVAILSLAFPFDVVVKKESRKAGTAQVSPRQVLVGDRVADVGGSQEGQSLGQCVVGSTNPVSF